MDLNWKTSVWQQFGAAIDMLDNALRACPDNLWADRSQRVEFWYVVYHTLFWLDLYLSGTARGFTPPTPFGLEELDPAGVLPERPFTRQELATYLIHCRYKCRETTLGLTDEKANQPCKFSWGETSFAELLLYNMRHVMYHVGELNLILGDKGVSAPDWVASARP